MIRYFAKTAAVTTALGILFVFGGVRLGTELVHAETKRDAHMLEYAKAPVLIADATPVVAPAISLPPVPMTVAVPPAPPVASDPADVSTVVKLWRNGSFLNAAILALYLLLPLVSKLTKKGALYIAATIGGLTMLVDLILAGQTLNITAFVGAAITIATILAHSPLPPAQPQPSRNPQSGRVRIEVFALVMAFFAAAGGIAACHGKAADTLGNGIKSCASEKLGVQVTTLKGIALTLLGAVADVAMADDWLAELEHIAAQVGEAAVDCAANDILAALHGASSTAVPRLQMWLDHHKHLVSPSVPPGHPQ